MPYMKPPLSKELWFTEGGKAGEELAFTDWHGERKGIDFESEAFYRDNGVQVLLRSTVGALDLETKTVRLTSGSEIAFDQVLVASGADPRRIAAVEGLPEERVTTYRTVKDFQRLYGLLGETGSKHVVVIGGGFLGSELAVAMARHCAPATGHAITQIFPEDGQMGLVFPKYLSQWTMGKMSALGVAVKNRCWVERAAQKGERVELVLSTGEKVLADHVVVAVGIEPATSFVPARVQGKAPGPRGVAVDAHLLAWSGGTAHHGGDAALETAFAQALDGLRAHQPPRKPLRRVDIAVGSDLGVLRMQTQALADKYRDPGAGPIAAQY